MQVVKLTPYPDECGQHAIKILEDMLAHAKAGHVHGIAIAAWSNVDGTLTTWSKCTNHPALIGAVAYLQHRIIYETNRSDVTIGDEPA